VTAENYNFIFSKFLKGILHTFFRVTYITSTVLFSLFLHLNNTLSAAQSNSVFFFSDIDSSFNKLLLQKEELEQKHLHLLQIVESEKTAKWQYTQQCEELASEIKKLRAEVSHISIFYIHIYIIFSFFMSEYIYFMILFPGNFDSCCMYFFYFNFGNIFCDILLYN